MEIARKSLTLDPFNSLPWTCCSTSQNRKDFREKCTSGRKNSFCHLGLSFSLSTFKFFFYPHHVHRTTKNFNQHCGEFFFLVVCGLGERQAKAQLINVTWKVLKKIEWNIVSSRSGFANAGGRRDISLFLCRFFSIKQLQILASYLHLFALCLSYGPFPPPLFRPRKGIKRLMISACDINKTRI